MRNFLPTVFFTGACLLVSGFAQAQTIVGTAPDNKNVVLEEYTGVNCQFCPDGHKRAQELYDANPDDMVLINIHVGSFAPNNPPYKTPWGSAIDNQADVSGYPAGSINRRTDLGVNYQANGSAMSRGEWANAAPTILGESSPVNIAIDVSVDQATREMTLLVEVYYTANGNGSDFLNIAMLQNNVKGPQIDSGPWYPEMAYPDGDYNHMHMLRELLTGQWGVEISNTSAGTFWDSTIVYTIPNNYHGLPVDDVMDMEVAAFIADDQENILTGTHAYMLPKSDFWDMDLTATYPQSDYCTSSTSADVTITNNGNTAITSFDLDYSVNGTVSSTSYSGSIAPGGSDVIAIGNIPLNPGGNVVSFSAPLNVNGGTLINPSASGFLSSPSALQVTSITTTGTLPLAVDCEAAIVGAIPTSLFEENPENLRMYVVDNTIVQGVDYPLGGFGNSAKSLRFDYWAIPDGGISALLTEKLDFSSLVTASFEFSKAYAQYDANTNDELNIYATIDCGLTWDLVWNQAGSELSTVPAKSDGRFYPNASDWETINVDLSSYTGESEVILKIEGVSNYGNNLHIDDFDLSGTTVSVNEIINTSSVNLYPNPTTDQVNLALTLNQTEEVSVRVFNALGSVLYNQRMNVSGTTNEVINTANFVSGIYFVEITAGGQTVTKKLMIK